ncbi:MAG: PRC-barrel domain-containing protein [Pseudomonadota bacterium]
MKRILTAASIATLIAASPALAQTTATTQTPSTNKAATQQPAKSGDRMTKVESMQGVHVSKLMGASILNARNESIGDVNDIVLGDGGEVDRVIVGVGGFLGLGERDVALKLRELNVMKDRDGDIRIMTQLSKKELEAVEAYKPRETRS